LQPRVAITTTRGLVPAYLSYVGVMRCDS
jgi:hypothetical protein